MSTHRLNVGLWDSYVLQQRMQNQAVRSQRLSEAGRLGEWRRRKKHLAIAEQIPIVKRIARTEARKFAAHLDVRDLVQQGMVGLMEAAQRYRPGRGGGFAQFAYFRIRGAIIDANKRRAYREELNDSLDRHVGQPTAGESSRQTLGDMIADESPLAIDELEHRQTERRMMAALGELPAADRELLQAWMEGKPIREQCRISGMSANYTRARITQIQGRVRASFMRRPPESELGQAARAVA